LDASIGISGGGIVNVTGGGKGLTMGRLGHLTGKSGPPIELIEKGHPMWGWISGDAGRHKPKPKGAPKPPAGGGQK